MSTEAGGGSSMAAATNKIGKNIRRKPAASGVGAGRPKGAPNKTTAALKEAILNAFTKVGGEDYLVRLAIDDPKTFAMLLAKVLPLTLSGDPNQPVSLVVSWTE